MAYIKCKMCGGDMELSSDKTFGTCEYCGSTMTLPKTDNEQRAAAFNRGNHFRRIGEFDKALTVFERIVAEDNSDAEAHWCCVLCRFGIEYVEDPASYEYVPTCHRASFDSVLEDVDYLAALEYSDGLTRRQYQKDAAKIAEVQRGILATSQGAEAYDVFISYKELDANGNRTRDSILAQDIYYQLTERGWRVFFSRISLEDVPGTQYEPYIFAALNSAKVMVVIGTSAENLNAVWVRNEWSRYLSLMRKDRSKLLVPCYRDMDPYDLPEQLAVLMSYDMGKIGFIQDLIRGIDKVLSADKIKELERETVKETVLVQQQSGVNTSALLKRGAMALEDGDWEKADGFFEEVLNHDAECVGAYIGKTLYETKSHSLDEFVKKLLEKHRQDSFKPLYIEKDAEHINASVKKFTLPGYLKANELLPLYDYKLQYSSRVDSRMLQKEQTLKDWDSYKWLARAQRFDPEEKDPSLTRAKRELNNQLERRIKEAQREEEEEKKKLEAAYAAHLAKADEKAKAAYDNAAKRREADYQSYLKSAKYENDISKLHNTAKLFEALNGYKDSVAQAEGCRSKAAEIKRRQELEAARLKAECAERTKKAAVIIGTVAALAAAVILVITTVIPAMKYSSAQEALDAGNYDEAIAAFAALDDYKDSAQQAEHANNLKIAELERIAAEKAAEAARLEAERQAAIEAEEKARQEAEAARLEAEAEAERARIAAEEAAEKARLEAEEAARLLYESSLEGRYEAAMELMEEEKIAEAAIAFGQIADYKDARELSFALWDDVSKDSISASECSTIALKADGTVLATEYTGYSYNGQCDVGGWTDIVAVSSGNYHTLALKSDGTVVSTKPILDYNDFRQDEVSNWRDIVAVSAGGRHSVGLRADGTVVATTFVGKQQNYYGQCEVSVWRDIVAVSAGMYSTVGLRADGTVVSTDKTAEENTWTDIVAISAGDYHTVGLRNDGTVVATHPSHDSYYVSFYSGQCDVEDWTDIVAISAGTWHTVGLRSDGTVVATEFKDNFMRYRGQCEVGDWTDIVGIAAGDHHTVGLKADGTVVAVGSDDDGRCDVSDWSDIRLTAHLSPAKLYAKAEAQLARGNKGAAAISFYKVGKFEDARERSLALWDEVAVRDTIAAGEDIIALRDNGSVLAADVRGRGNRISWSSMIAVDTGRYLSIGLKSDGTVICRNYHDGDKRFYDETLKDWKDIVAVSVNSGRAFGLRADGTVLVYSPDDGYNSPYDGYDVVSTWTDIVSVSAGGSGLGLKSDGTVVAIVTDLSDWENVKAISARGKHNVGLLEDGTVVASGDNKYGQCDVSDWTDIVAVSAGTWHTVGLKSDGTVVAVGDNEFNKCDVSGWKDIVAIRAGNSDTVGLKADGTVVTVGMSKEKGIDFSNWTDIKLPVVRIDTQPTTSKAATPENTKAPISNVTISAGSNHTVALKSDGTVVAVGSNEYGKCDVSGWTDIVAVSAGNGYTVGLKADGTVVAVGSNKYGKCDVSGWTDIVAVSAGSYHTVGLKSDGTVVATKLETGMHLDYIDYSMVDVGDWADIVAISASFNNTVGLKSDGTVVAVGDNAYGQCDVGAWTDIVAISSAQRHTVGLKADGTVVAVGSNYNGQCRVSDWTDIVAISAGDRYTIGLKPDGTVVAAGDNSNGQCIVSDWTDIVAISTYWGHTVGLKSNGTVVAVGNNENGQCDVGNWTDIRVPEV